jgi:DHA1 family tetracycline resistance protein-like MFS transporter
MLGAAFGAGFVIGPALGGLAGGIDPRLPFWIAAGLSLANFLYGFFILPESLSKESRMPFSFRRANPLGALKLLSAHRELLGLSGANFLGHLAHAALPNVGVLYMHYRYGWSELTMGFVLAGVGICAIVVQAGLIGPVIKRFGERRALLGAILIGVAGFAVHGLATNGPVFLIGVPLLALWGIANPSSLAIMSKRVGADEQGQLQGANASVMGLANLIGPGLFTLTFAYAIRPELGITIPGAPFLLAALLLLCAMAVAWTATKPGASS